MWIVCVIRITTFEIKPVEKFTCVSAHASGFPIFPTSSSRVNSLRLFDDQSIFDQLLDVLTCKYSTLTKCKNSAVKGADLLTDKFPAPYDVK